MEEKRLLMKLKNGDTAALEKIIKHYTNYVGTIVYNIIGAYMNEEDVEEVVSDVFVTVWKQAEQIKDGCLKGFLAQVARRASIKKLRKIKKEFLTDEDEWLQIPSKQSVEDVVLLKEREEVLRETLKRMDKTDRQIFLRYYYFGQKINDIAYEIGMTPSAVKVRLHRGRTKLKKMIEEGGYFYEDNGVDG